MTPAKQRVGPRSGSANLANRSEIGPGANAETKSEQKPATGQEGMNCPGSARPAICRVSWWWVIVATVLAWFWAAQSHGLVSSNDGSHLALARAVALHGRTQIGKERALTLKVDVAEREGQYYSDRPPGTAMLALPVVRLGAVLDPVFLQASREAGHVLVQPATGLYMATYNARFESPRPLAQYLGTISVLAFHTVLVGLVGLGALWHLLQLCGLRPKWSLLAIFAVAGGSLWGPYATTLFSHTTAATMLTCFLAASLSLATRIDSAANDRSDSLRRRGVMILAGVSGSWAISAEYTLLLVVVALALLVIPRRDYVGVLLSVVPLSAFTAMYHQSAFGSPWLTGYHFHSNFQFTHSLGGIFGGSFSDGVGYLWGWTNGGGLLSLSPVMAVGVIGLGFLPKLPRRAALCFAPWVLVLCFHTTPWGGATADYRYLTPLLPVLALGLAAVCEQAERLSKLKRSLVFSGVGLLLVWSVRATWQHFGEWREVEAFASMTLATCVAAAVLVLTSGGVLLVRRGACNFVVVFVGGRAREQGE